MRADKQVRAQPTSPPKKPPAATEQAIFMQAVADVTPLRQSLPYPHPPQAVSPWPLHHLYEEERDSQDGMSDFWPWDSMASDEEARFLRPGQKHDTLKKLQRGHWPVQASLDLHGFNSDQARMAVGGFVLDCVARRRRCVRIVHGKGLSSRNNEPVLKNKLRNWLAQREEVLGFCQAGPADGGAGAVVLLLRGR
ncbi:DNA mismatch repair protein MutS [Chitinimonas arctica]|uniref:DNA mismatch repair protein MutS n=2 Tax=Chitinimonas arctica TaxID=2594795 RepID=A0A516SM03_9NEIS|nr:DNA mismatch repair protein MutS [Chitinimonas arctica]